MMNEEKFATFSETYRKCLAEAVALCPDEYAWPVEQVPTVAAKMLNGIRTRPYGVSYDSTGFKLTCKALGIKHTRKAIFAYLELQTP